MNQYKISPKYFNTDFPILNTEDKIAIFEDQVMGWQLNWSEYLNGKGCEHAGFAVLHLSSTYFESISMYIKGESSDGNGGKFFKETFKDVFKELETTYSTDQINAAANLMWTDARNGFYHFGMAKRAIVLHDKSAHENLTIRLLINQDEVMGLLIDRYGYIQLIKEHFSNYITLLKNPAETGLRANFLKGWQLYQA